MNKETKYQPYRCALSVTVIIVGNVIDDFFKILNGLVFISFHSNDLERHESIFALNIEVD